MAGAEHVTWWGCDWRRAMTDPWYSKWVKQTHLLMAYYRVRT